MPEPILKVKKLTKAYDDKLAVDAISFDVKKGETFGILARMALAKRLRLR